MRHFILQLRKKRVDITECLFKNFLKCIQRRESLKFDQLRFNLAVFTLADPEIYGEKVRLLCVVGNPAVIRNRFL
jgi:hypothetical protein